MYIPAAVVCCGLGILIRLANGSGKMTYQILRQAIPVNDLKGLGECLENEEIENPIVVVRGTVGSTSTVDKSDLGVFIEERAKLDIEVTDASGSVVPESKTKFVTRKEVPWYLDDGTARVYVCNYRLAEGFYDTLKQYFSREPFSTYLKTFDSDGKEKLMLTDDVDCWKRQQVLEIGTYLTVVGTAVRDKDGAPTISAYRFFNGHIELDDFVNDLELGLETGGNLSLYLIALSAVLVALNILRT
ncbi:E3 ubiquitin-protein ligase SP1 isoform X1 [Raphanus sativus]|uniref:RING-type E3 ubiquitin transferase n=1 Tax=Raphanus sativus TaxID=3726 RepID=A0A6J0MQY3_RAPSA|nr:E3 ubiquitin-protein ligase SP1 isoform X1 [Raphanus sativus]